MSNTIVVRKITAAQFALCAILGAGLWIASPYLAGTREAWDNGFYYSGGLLIIGFIGGLLDPPRCWLAPVSVFVGQVFPLIILMVASGRPSPFGLLGLVFVLPMYSLVSLFGACIGAGTGHLTRAVLRRTRNTQPSIDSDESTPPQTMQR